MPLPAQHFSPFASPREAFTLVEVLIALFITAALACTVAATASVCRRTEHAADATVQTAEILPALYAAALLDAPRPSPPGWTSETTALRSMALATNLTATLRETTALPLQPDLPPATFHTLAP